MKTGLICRMDKSGLGFQTRRLARMIKPDKIMLIDSSLFNERPQHLQWYENYTNKTVIRGFPQADQIAHFLEGLDKVISCELFYHKNFTNIARDLRVETILVANPEFFDWYQAEWAFTPLPNKVLVPSKWKLKEMKDRFGAKYLPTPIFDDEFNRAYRTNLDNDSVRYLFINGTSAVHDRSGLETLYEAMQLSKGDYTVTIKSQSRIPYHPDPRLSYDSSNPDSPAELYMGYSALISPRRYAGQSLPMNEALLSCLPVIMLDIDPNNKVLPKKWLIPAQKTGSFMTRTEVDIYEGDARALAVLLDTLDVSKSAKMEAYRIGSQFSADTLASKYEELVK